MNLADYTEEKPHRIKRIVWCFVNHTFFFILIGKPLMKVRTLILRLFGAKIDNRANVYNSCRIFAPWNLTIGRACIGPRTELYSKDKISIGDDSVVSQGSVLCTASHDISSTMLPLKTAPIIIEDNVWVASDCFIGMGVTLHKGAVVGACAAVFKDVAEMNVVGGNPAELIKIRKIKNSNNENE